MRYDDIRREYDPDNYRTEEMYLPHRKRLRDMNLEETRKGLCLRCDGKEDMCRTCPGKCVYGIRALKLAEEARLHPEAAEAPKPEERPNKRIEHTLTTAQLEHAERMRRERRARVAVAQKYIDEGYTATYAAKMAGYAKLDSLRRAQEKCWLEKSKEGKNHV